MRGEPGALYDAHAERLYAYCWSLVGDDVPAAVRDTFTAAVQDPPRGDAVLWLYALARTACARRGGDRVEAAAPTTEPEPTEPEPTETADPTPTPTGNPTPGPTGS